MYTPKCEFVHTLFHSFFLYLRTKTKNDTYNIIISYNMSIIEFYKDTPVLAGIFTLAYTIVVGLFVYMLVELYKNH